MFNIKRNANFQGGAGGFGGRRKNVTDNIKDIKLPPFKFYHLIVGFFVLLIIWLLTGLYKVELQEQAVILIFGKHTSTKGPGLGWAPPAPIGNVIKVKTEEIKKVEIGFRSDNINISQSELLKESEMLTKGTNIVDIQMTVQYTVSDPVKFLFAVADISRQIGDRGLYKTVKGVAEAALREVIGNTEVDAVLTFGKAIIQQQVQELMQNILDIYQCGISINLVQLQNVAPPEPVAEAFRDVNNASEDKDRKKREAEGYRNSVIPEARGEAAKIIAEAEAYKETKLNRAKGDAARFESQLAEYRKAPSITKKRIYIETMEEILTKIDKIVIDPSVKGILPMLNINEFKKTTATKLSENDNLTSDNEVKK